MHDHEWTPISQISEGNSVDSYYSCGCGCKKILHVYTYAPTDIRHENLHDCGSWTDGYAHGIARGMKG